MKLINLMAEIDREKCTNCKVCESVCPVLAIKRENREVVIEQARCHGCGACEQRCPYYAITMIKRDPPIKVGVDVNTVDYDKIIEICNKARLNPEQIVCFCTATRAEEVAAAILNGAKSPEDVSFMTGVRTGCKVECIQPVLRLLEAAGIELKPPKNGWQWYGRTATVWEISEKVKKKYSSRGFYFDEDLELLNKVVSARLQGGREGK